MSDIKLTQNYKVGELSRVISRNKNKKKSTASGKERKKLATLFSGSECVDCSVAPTADSSEIRKKRKRKHKDVEVSDTKQPSKSSTSHQNDGYDPPEGIVHESLQQKTKQPSGKVKKQKTEEDLLSEDDTEQVQQKSKKRRERDKTKDNKTVFVGNLPVKMEKKALKKLFRKFGEIESVRFRCPPPADLKQPKKVIAIRKNFHPDRKNMIGFVCFKDEDSTKAALKLNGKKVEGHHLQVDLASNEKKHDHKCSVFVGNLTYDIAEDSVREHFEDCGKIKNVRIIRDNRTGIGKGFCYVTFSDRDAVSFAMKLNNSELSGRSIRVLQSQENPTPSSDNSNKKVGFQSTKKKLKAKPSNTQQGTFQGLKSDSKQKRKSKEKKMKKKKQQVKKSKVFSSMDQSSDQRKRNFQNATQRLQNKKKKKQG